MCVCLSIYRSIDQHEATNCRHVLHNFPVACARGSGVVGEESKGSACFFLFYSFPGVYCDPLKRVRAWLKSKREREGERGSILKRGRGGECPAHKPFGPI